MKLKFWDKASKKSQETTLKVSIGVSGSKEYYVCAQTPDKAEELMKKLRDNFEQLQK